MTLDERIAELEREVRSCTSRDCGTCPKAWIELGRLRDERSAREDESPEIDLFDRFFG